MTDLLTLLKGEQERIASAMPAMTPGSEEYTRAFELLRAMHWMEQEMTTPVAELIPAPPTFTRAQVITDTPAPVEEKPAVSFDETAFRAALRERMADARLAGVNTTDLLKSVGASKLSAVPVEKLEELSAAVDAAMKEKS